jgi:hypothetical protein
MTLDEKHQKVAIEIVQRNRTRKSCNKCYDRGYIGFTTDKTIVPCEKCVDMEKAMEEWKVYVAQDEALKEDFKELFEEEETVEDAESTEDTPDGAEPASEAKTPTVEKIKGVKKSEKAENKTKRVKKTDKSNKNEKSPAIHRRSV